MNNLRFFLRECLGYVELFVIPAIAVILPWSITIMIYRFLAKIPLLYRGSTNARFSGAQQLNLASATDEKKWKHKTKTGQIIDLADAFLLLTRSDGFVKKYISDTLSGRLVQQQIIFTPHYGAGVWIYRLLKRKKITVAMLINHPQGRFRVHDLSARFRLWTLRKAGVLVFDPIDIMAVRTALKEGRSLLIMPDMPVTEGMSSHRIATEYGDLHLASRFFELAEARKIPVIHAIFDVDVKTGMRYFSGEEQQGLSAIEYMNTFATHLISSLQRHSHLWHMLVVGPQVMLNHNKQQQ